VARVREARLGTSIELQRREGPLIAGWGILFSSSEYALRTVRFPVDNACGRAPDHSMRPKNRRVYAGDFPSAYIGENIMFKHIKQLVRKQRWRKLRTQPLPEEDLGGGDICSLPEQPSTDDDQPLD
jgi:hypothetical protein